MRSQNPFEYSCYGQGYFARTGRAPIPWHSSPLGAIIQLSGLEGASLMGKPTGFRGLLSGAMVVVWALSGAAPAAERLRLVTDFYRGPYEHIEDDETPGFNIELVRQVFAAMGQDVSFEAFPNYRGWSMIARGECDGLFRSPRNSERERICSFPDEPLAWDKWVLFVRTTSIGKLKFSSFDDLVGHDVAVWKTTPDLF